MTGKFDRSLRMLSTALDMEEKGKEFYEGAIETAKNEVGRDIFRTLMEDENIHMDRIRKIYASLSDNQAWSEEWKGLKVKHDDLGELFRQMAKKHGAEITADTSDLEALDIGIDFESRSVEFYEEQLTKAVDPLEQEFIRKMVTEERSHHAALTDMKLYLSDPAGWFREKEHGGLDGG
ncbi:MAG: ferritin family protein [Proteobacteria bacterium]|nr:ferritin family protein [Pseudomonadota bacterium]